MIVRKHGRISRNPDGTIHLEDYFFEFPRAVDFARVQRWAERMMRRQEAQERRTRTGK